GLTAVLSVCVSWLMRGTPTRQSVRAWRGSDRPPLNEFQNLRYTLLPKVFKWAALSEWNRLAGDADKQAFRSPFLWREWLLAPLSLFSCKLSPLSQVL